MDTRDLRKHLGLTQEQMARACNVSVSTIRAWDQGLRKPTGSALRLLEVLEREHQGTRVRRNDADAEAEDQEEDRLAVIAERRYLKRRREGKQPRGYTAEEFLAEWDKA